MYSSTLSDILLSVFLLEYYTLLVYRYLRHMSYTSLSGRHSLFGRHSLYGRPIYVNIIYGILPYIIYATNSFEFPKGTDVLPKALTFCQKALTFYSLHNTLRVFTIFSVLETNLLGICIRILYIDL